MKCNWYSNGNRSLKCNRHADSSGYCIFHKENKNKPNIIFEHENGFKNGAR